MDVRDRRAKDRERKKERYWNGYREKQIKMSGDYQRRMWAESQEFRDRKNFQKKNPKQAGRGRPRIELHEQKY